MTIHQLHPVLTMQAMDNPPEATEDRTAWEPALSYRIPENPSLELLKRAREEVLAFLDYASSDLAAPSPANSRTRTTGEADFVRKEIARAAARLTQIALLLPTALTSAVDAQLVKDRDERLREWCERRGLRLVSNHRDPKPG